MYVWAIEQDDLSKRAIPVSTGDQPQTDQAPGQDVFVPWVLSQQQPRTKKPRRQKNALVQAEEPETLNPVPAPQTFHRYYHMFAQGELDDLLRDAAQSSGIALGNPDDFAEGTTGVQIVQSGWERSNYYLEFRLYQRQ